MQAGFPVKRRRSVEYYFITLVPDIICNQQKHTRTHAVHLHLPNARLVHSSNHKCSQLDPKLNQSYLPIIYLQASFLMTGSNHLRFPALLTIKPTKHQSTHLLTEVYTYSK